MNPFAIHPPEPPDWYWEGYDGPPVIDEDDVYEPEIES